ncbi:MAG TPA: SDR family oxidoreductase [Bacteroidales bacterium]|nr:SDR family oxidoreductase [Bacteroidales bacterium]
MDLNNKWAIVLGGSGGLGFSAAKLLSDNGYNLILVFRERKVREQKFLQSLNTELKQGTKTICFNGNVADQKFLVHIINELQHHHYNVSGNIALLLHAVADGNLKPVVSSTYSQQALTTDEYQYTIATMGLSFGAFIQSLFENKMFSSHASAVAITSEGSKVVLPDYAAVGAAKAVLETSMKYFAVKLGRHGVRVNLINAGITDTEALKKFPAYSTIIHKARLRNPMGRITQCDDVAQVVLFLAGEGALFVNGTVINVDGGEQWVAYE